MRSHTYHHGNLHDALLQEASTVLEADGAGALSLRALARALGVSHAAPAHHFATRDALLAELAADGYAALADALEGTDAADRPVASARAYVRFALANPERYRLMFTGRLRFDEAPERLTSEADRAYRALLRTSYAEPPELDMDTYRLGAPELRSWALVHGAVLLHLDGQLIGDMDTDDLVALIEEAVRIGTGVHEPTQKTGAHPSPPRRWGAGAHPGDQSR